MNICKLFIHEWIDLIFPPICSVCKEQARAPVFCLQCWEECKIVEREGRCGHCFEELDGNECLRCKEKEALGFPSAFVFESTEPANYLLHYLQDDPEMLASFALVQWGRLNWPIPDYIIPMSGKEKVAKAFGLKLQRPFSGISFEEEKTFLLLGEKNTYEGVANALESLIAHFPKKIYILTFLPLSGSYDFNRNFDLFFQHFGDHPVSGRPHRSGARSLDRGAAREIQPEARAGT